MVIFEFPHATNQAPRDLLMSSLPKAKRSWRTRDLPEHATRDTDETLWAKFRREAPCVVQVLKDQRSEMHEVLVSIVQPGAGRQGEDARVLLYLDANELDGARTQESKICYNQ